MNTLCFAKCTILYILGKVLVGWTDTLKNNSDQK